MVATAYPIRQITTATISISFGKKINRKARTKLIIHTDTNSIVTSKFVTFLCLRNQIVEFEMLFLGEGLRPFCARTNLLGHI